MDYSNYQIIILLDSLTSGVSSAFQKWENEKGEKEVVTLTATKGNLVSLEKENTFADLKNVVYIGDDPEISKRINTDGGTTFSTTEFINLTDSIIEACSTFNTEQSSFVNSFSEGFKNPRMVIYKIKKLNKIGLYLRKPKNI